MRPSSYRVRQLKSLGFFVFWSLGELSRYGEEGQVQSHVMMKTGKYVNTPPPNAKLGHC